MDRYNDLAEIDLDEMRRRDPRSNGWRGDGPRGGRSRNFGERPRMAQPRPARGAGRKVPGRRNRSRWLPGGPRGRNPRGPNGPGGLNGPGGPGALRPPVPRRRKILKWTSIATTVVLVSASLAAYAAYRDVFDGVKQVNVSDLLGKRPPEYTSAMNILVIGSDSRAGTKGKFGSAQAIAGARSDTMMLLHILPQHQGGVVVSFPRDSVVPIIACKADGMGDPGQKAQPGATEMLNAAFAFGGAPCLWKTLEAETGVFINHFVEINFNGFQSVVNDLGGVNVCLPEAIKDPASGLDLPAGLHHVNGAQALSFVRERHIGEGSDLQRIQRQQFFMASLLQQIDSKNALSNMTQLFAIARDVAKTLTTDSGLSVSNMLSLAQSMKGMTSKSVQFTQVPVVQDPTDANRVEWTQPQAGQLFSEIAHDQSVPKKSSGSGKASPKATPAATASTSKVGIKVLNATNTSGLARKAATALAQQHYTVTGTGNAVAPSSSTIIQYSAASDAAGAKALAQMVPNAVVQQVAGVTTGTVDLILGANFSGVSGGTASSGSSSGSGSGSASGSGSGSGSGNSSSPNIGSVTKNFGGITGNTNICRDSGAFAGPDVPSDFHS
jgi:LCP family protein required for cell wall assembly